MEMNMQAILDALRGGSGGPGVNPDRRNLMSAIGAQMDENTTGRGRQLPMQFEMTGDPYDRPFDVPSYNWKGDPYDEPPLYPWFGEGVFSQRAPQRPPNGAYNQNALAGVGTQAAPVGVPGRASAMPGIVAGSMPQLRQEAATHSGGATSEAGRSAMPSNVVRAPAPMDVVPPEMVGDFKAAPDKQAILNALIGGADPFDAFAPQQDGGVIRGGGGALGIDGGAGGDVLGVDQQGAGGATADILAALNIPQAAQSPFRDDQAYQTADMDAFRLMQLDPQYGPAVNADINTTEGQRLSLLRQMLFADAALDDPRLPKAMTSMANDFASKFGALGRLYTGDEYELGRLMATQFANAVLRNDSGANAPETEVARYARQYFPLPNETDAQLTAKASLRREVIRSLEQALGGDASPAVVQMRQELDDLKRQADTDSVVDLGGGVTIRRMD